MGVQMGEKKKRRQFTKEFRAEAVRLVRETGKPVSEVARDIDVTETSLYAWVRQERIDRGEGAPGALSDCLWGVRPDAAALDRLGTSTSACSGSTLLPITITFSRGKNTPQKGERNAGALL